MKLRLWTVFGLFLTSTALMLLHVGALGNFWYWVFPWFDILTHFLGGMVVAFGMLLIYQYILFGRVSWSKKIIRQLTIWYVLFIGVLWEVFEVVIGSTGFGEDHYWVDSISDLFVDVAGGMAVYLIFTSILLTYIDRA